MRDFRDAKAMAQTLRSALAAKGHKITIGESLELIAKALGATDWNTLSAAIKAAADDKAAEPRTVAGPLAPAQDDEAALDRVAASLGWNDWQALTAALRTVGPDQPGRLPTGEPGAPFAPPTGNLAMDRLAVALGWVDWAALSAALRSVLPGQPGRRASSQRDGSPASPSARPGGTRFSDDMTRTLHLSVALATERSHIYTTLEHLLLALTEDPDAAEVMRACQVDIAALRTAVTRYIDEDLTTIVGPAKHADDELRPHEPAPTAGFHRVVQRSVIHVQSSGRDQVTGANLLVAIFSERESHAFHFLRAQKMDRYDAVNFIANGVRKGGAAA